MVGILSDATAGGGEGEWEWEDATDLTGGVGTAAKSESGDSD